jgi:hypothetical protein
MGFLIFSERHTETIPLRGPSAVMPGGGVGHIRCAQDAARTPSPSKDNLNLQGTIMRIQTICTDISVGEMLHMSGKSYYFQPSLTSFSKPTSAILQLENRFQSDTFFRSRHL